MENDEFLVASGKKGVSKVVIVDDAGENRAYGKKKLQQCGVRIKSDLWRCFLSEFLGTFVLVTFGVGTMAQTVLGSREPMPHGDIVTVNIGWGLAVAMGVFVAGGASQAHINPAISLAQAITGRLSWRKFPFYVLGQYLGAFMAAVCICCVYYDALNDFDGGHRTVHGPNATAGIWATYPQDHVTTVQGFFDQAFATGILVIMIMAITDEKNMAVPKGLVPLAIGSAVVGLCTAFGYNCGAALNPARDLGPRIFTAVAGWGMETFSYRDFNWFWVPVLGPHVGAVVGMFIYYACISAHWPDQDRNRIQYKEIPLEPLH